MDDRKKKNLIWKVEAVLFGVVLLVFGAIFAATHAGGLIQHQDSVQFLNKGWPEDHFRPHDNLRFLYHLSPYAY